ncbi:hypothetical protein [Microvirga lotononidis]|uniref:Uncharacterized protein n=1 Tax=Microvirga lotononidis TaxID=864069 RepID=I4YTC1_9HYPH|nr:hypothetical protein [Microvirga lotononidis]EIM27213.1 hypothetical protein MicloDRAFT_00037700 [Microvirga lotononidis]WQO28608.1 hypothetical protein U0023_05900 [Microvirga lotononidis]
MARKPEDVKPPDGRPLQSPAAENARTGQDAPPHDKVHPKVHKNQDEEPVQDATGQPVVEDEP